VLTYTATGAEGTTLTLPALAGKTIITVFYNTLVLIPETPPPDAQGYSYDPGTQTFTFGFPLNPDDVIQIIYT
jgi:hypothetical protein